MMDSIGAYTKYRNAPLHLKTGELLMAENDFDFSGLEKRLGVSRRTFLKFCTGVAASLGLSSNAAMAMAKAVADPKRRPPVIWLHGQECTGPTEALLRCEQPTLEHLLLDLISLDYHQTLDTGAGHQVEEIKKRSMQENKGKYLLVIEGAIPVKDNGIYCKIAGETMLALTQPAVLVCSLIPGVLQILLQWLMD